MFCFSKVHHACAIPHGTNGVKPLSLVFIRNCVSTVVVSGKFCPLACILFLFKSVSEFSRPGVSSSAVFYCSINSIEVIWGLKFKTPGFALSVTHILSNGASSLWDEPSSLFHLESLYTYPYFHSLSPICIHPCCRVITTFSTSSEWGGF